MRLNMVTAAQLIIMRHALGLDDHGRGREYRNHYVLGPECADYALCRALCDQGLMTNHGDLGFAGGMHGFAVTEAGRVFVREFAPPPERMSPGRRRYLAWLKRKGAHEQGR